MTGRTPAPAAARRAVPGRAVPGWAVSALAGAGIAAVLVGRTWPGAFARLPDGRVPTALDSVSPVLLVVGTVALMLATVCGGRVLGAAAGARAAVRDRGPAGVRRRRTPSPRTRRSGGR